MSTGVLKGCAGTRLCSWLSTDALKLLLTFPYHPAVLPQDCDLKSELGYRTPTIDHGLMPQPCQVPIGPAANLSCPCMKLILAPVQLCACLKVHVCQLAARAGCSPGIVGDVALLQHILAQHVLVVQWAPEKLWCKACNDV